MPQAISQNQIWHQKFNTLIPFGSSTYSKAPTFMPDEPATIVKGKGCRVWDADGNEYIDFRNGLGPVTLGYQFPAVDEAIREQLKSGITFGHPHPLEYEVAEMISQMVPCAEQVRFLKTGGEAVAACIRIARAYTNKNHILHINYSGWLNQLAAGGFFMPGKKASGTIPGVPQCISDLHHHCQWGNIDNVKEVFLHFKNDVAAILVAPDIENFDKGGTFLKELRDITRKENSALIFDEVVTGFRVSEGGVQKYFDVKPDLAAFAKAVANGMPLSVYCGTKEVMGICERAGVFVSSTLGGETLSLAAAKAVLNVIKKENVINHLWKNGEMMWKGVKELLSTYKIPMLVKGPWVCPKFVTSPDAPADLREKFFRSAYRNGVSLYDVPYINYSHKVGDIEEALQRIEKAIREIQ